MKWRAACAKISEYFNLKVEQCSGLLSLLERNYVLAVLSSGLGKSPIFKLFVIVAEKECHMVYVAFTEHYQGTHFRSQNHGSFSCINCWFKGRGKVSVISANAC